MKLKFLDKLPKLPEDRAKQAKSIGVIVTGGALAILYVKGLIWFWNVIPY